MQMQFKCNPEWLLFFFSPVPVVPFFPPLLLTRLFPRKEERRKVRARQCRVQLFPSPLPASYCPCALLLNSPSPTEVCLLLSGFLCLPPSSVPGGDPPVRRVMTSPRPPRLPNGQSDMSLLVKRRSCDAFNYSSDFPNSRLSASPQMAL